MKDPFPPPPAALARLVQPLADALGLTTLPLHIHEVLLAFTVYHLINTRLAPWLSRALVPRSYAALTPRSKINWDVHVVSLFQSCTINALALWVMWADQERAAMLWRSRVFGYTGACGLIQGFATGYFLWDLMITVQNVHAFGWGMLAHAVSALVVFSLGFRPFVNFYGPTFILYELSSPFLNIHWFFDKMDMTGSWAQLINGLVLLTTFFSCRLVWGTYQSIWVYRDVLAALQARGHAREVGGAAAQDTTTDGAGESMRFAGAEVVPVWLAVIYLSSNVVLTCLNFYWFRQMVQAVHKRFQPAKAKTEHHTGQVALEVHANGAATTQVDFKPPSSVGSEQGRSRVVAVDESVVRRRPAIDDEIEPVAVVAL
ncbi:MAG: hypothetical protein M1832_001110 [Thelocarpon impressellum]|nr:MAG: hypothetical protein M1832_001110 [Thelocarpon impressellum]